MSHVFSNQTLDELFHLLGAELAAQNAPPVGLVICGGAALLATGLHHRTTIDVDVVALVNGAGELTSPAPLPGPLVWAATRVAEGRGLPPEWLNNGPSSDSGGLFQMGLPAGIQERLHSRAYGAHLTAHFIDRVDQIHFKLYAAVDRGGYHISDLEILRPKDDELIAAAQWAMTHDVSPAFRSLLKTLLDSLGHADAARAI